MKPSKLVSTLITCQSGYATARKAAAACLRESKRWWKLGLIKWSTEAAMRAGWWKRTAEEWNLEMMKAWA